MAFREDQEPIMDYMGGSMAIPAVPGAGKTFILANLVGEIIEEERQRPGKVLVVTYMNSAVNNFKGRIARILEEKGIRSKKDYDVMTIHSLALKILKEYAHVVLVDEEFKILDDLKKVEYLKNCINQWRTKDYDKTFRSFLNKQNKKWENDFRDVVSTLMSTLKLNDIDPCGLEEKIKNKEDSKILHAISPIYREYDKLLKIHGYLDYDDLLVLAYKILKNNEDARERFQKKYTYIFEDECQDSNIIQGKILTFLSKGSGNLIRVGDMNQSITGTFTSSDPKFFKEFVKKADVTHTMDYANRSTEDIIHLANFLVDKVRMNHPVENCKKALVDQKIKPVPKGPWNQNPKAESCGIFAYNVSTWEEEIKKTIRSIMGFKKKYPDKTMAVLVPNNNQVKEVALKLEEIGIDYDELSSNSQMRLKTCKDLGYILDYLSEPDDNEKFTKIVDRMLNTKDEENKRTLLDVMNHCSLENILFPGKNHGIEEYFPESLRGTLLLREFEEKLKILKEILDLPQHSLSKLIIEISHSLGFGINEMAMVEAIVFYIHQTLKGNPYLKIGDLAQELLRDWQNVFRFMGDKIYDLDGYEPVAERITVSTYHKAKGLEWDCVFLLGLTAYNFPSFLDQNIRSECNYLKDKYKNPMAIGKAEIEKMINNVYYKDPAAEAKIALINERIRLVYVGITRAKEFLVLMTHHYNPIFKRNEEVSLYYTWLSKEVKEKGEG